MLQFRVAGDWWTWIDYARFHELMARHRDSNGGQSFTATDYMYKTPEWAAYGADERGFDPQDTRFFRKKRKDISGC